MLFFISPIFLVCTVFKSIWIKASSTSKNISDPTGHEFGWPTPLPLIREYIILSAPTAKSEIKKQDGDSFIPKRLYEPALPTFYNKGKKNEKICLTYFLTILYEDTNLNILNINIICMPNGELENYYKDKVLQAGKNPDKTRFRYSNIPNFELLEKNPKRIKFVYFDKKMNPDILKDLNFFENIYNKQDN